MKPRRNATKPPEGLERRVVSLERCEIREGAEGEPPVFTGYAAVFDDLSLDLGGFRERISPTCFDASLAADCDVRALINHDSNLIFGRTTAGTLTISTDERGLKVEAPLELGLSYVRDLKISMDRGDIAEMSFGFRATKDAWEHTDKESGLPIRELLAADLFDVSPVTFPAYPTTSAEVRKTAAHVKELRSIADGDPLADFPVADADQDWDQAAAEARVRTFLAGPTVAETYLRCCFGARMGLLFCDVVDDTLVAVPAAIRSIGDALQADETAANEGLFEVLDADTRGKLKAEIGGWYQRLATELADETIVAPWVAEAREGKTLSATTAASLGEARDHAQACSDTLKGMLDEAGSVETNDLGDPDRPNFVAFFKRLTEARELAKTEEREWDWDDDWDVYLLTNMIGMASSYMVSEDGETPSAMAMREIMTKLSDMLAAAITDTDDAAETNAAAELDIERRRARLHVVEISA